MANLQKFTKTQIGAITRHFERYQKDDGEYIQFHNQEIDTTKTQLNYNLSPSKNQLEFIKKRTEELKVFNRSDVNVMANWVVTLPKEIKENSSEEKLFFEEAFDFLKEKYGERNIVSAHVHKDETTPHMHFAFVPVVFDKNKNKEKVSAKILLDRTHLKQFHGELSEHMEKVFGRDIGIVNETTKEGNKEISELKQDTRLKQTKILEKRIEVLEKKENALQAKIDALQDELKGKVLTKKGFEKIQPEISRFGIIKNISMEDIENMKKTLLAYFSKNANLAENMKTLTIQNERLKSQIPSLDEKIKQARHIHTLENELKTARKEFNKWQSVLDELPEPIKNEISNITENMYIEQSQSNRHYDFDLEM